VQGEKELSRSAHLGPTITVRAVSLVHPGIEVFCAAVCEIGALWMRDDQIPILRICSPNCIALDMEDAFVIGWNEVAGPCVMSESAESLAHNAGAFTCNETPHVALHMRTT